MYSSTLQQWKSTCLSAHRCTLLSGMDTITRPFLGRMRSVEAAGVQTYLFSVRSTKRLASQKGMHYKSGWKEVFSNLSSLALNGWMKYVAPLNKNTSVVPLT